MSHKTVSTVYCPFGCGKTKAGGGTSSFLSTSGAPRCDSSSSNSEDLPFSRFCSRRKATLVNLSTNQWYASQRPSKKCISDRIIGCCTILTAFVLFCSTCEWPGTPQSPSRSMVSLQKKHFFSLIVIPKPSSSRSGSSIYFEYCSSFCEDEKITNIDKIESALH